MRDALQLHLREPVNMHPLPLCPLPACSPASLPATSRPAREVRKNSAADPRALGVSLPFARTTGEQHVRIRIASLGNARRQGGEEEAGRGRSRRATPVQLVPLTPFSFGAFVASARGSERESLSRTFASPSETRGSSAGIFTTLEILSPRDQLLLRFRPKRRIGGVAVLCRYRRYLLLWDEQKCQRN